MTYAFLAGLFFLFPSPWLSICHWLNGCSQGDKGLVGRQISRLNVPQMLSPFYQHKVSNADKREANVSVVTVTNFSCYNKAAPTSCKNVMVLKVNIIKTKLLILQHSVRLFRCKPESFWIPLFSSRPMLIYLLFRTTKGKGSHFPIFTKALYGPAVASLPKPEAKPPVSDTGLLPLSPFWSPHFYVWPPTIHSPQSSQTYLFKI